MITRMILVSVPKEKAVEAERLWKEDCGPLMIEQPGCKTEQFLRGRENPPANLFRLAPGKARKPSTDTDPATRIG